MRDAISFIKRLFFSAEHKRPESSHVLDYIEFHGASFVTLVSRQNENVTKLVKLERGYLRGKWSQKMGRKSTRNATNLF